MQSSYYGRRSQVRAPHAEATAFVVWGPRYRYYGARGATAPAWDGSAFRAPNQLLRHVSFATEKAGGCRPTPRWHQGTKLLANRPCRVHGSRRAPIRAWQAISTGNSACRVHWPRPPHALRVGCSTLPDQPPYASPFGVSGSPDAYTEDVSDL